LTDPYLVLYLGPMGSPSDHRRTPHQKELRRAQQKRRYKRLKTQELIDLLEKEKQINEQLKKESVHEAELEEQANKIIEKMIVDNPKIRTSKPELLNEVLLYLKSKEGISEQPLKSVKLKTPKLKTFKFPKRKLT